MQEYIRREFEFLCSFLGVKATLTFDMWYVIVMKTNFTNVAVTVNADEVQFNLERLDALAMNMAAFAVLGKKAIANKLAQHIIAHEVYHVYQYQVLGRDLDAEETAEVDARYELAANRFADAYSGCKPLWLYLYKIPEIVVSYSVVLLAIVRAVKKHKGG